VVQRGSGFVVYCTFLPRCRTQRSMYIDSRITSTHERLNDTTIFLRVENITEKRTYSCSSDCHPPLDACGLDILAGYPPDKPKNISCIYKILKNDTGSVNCSWDRGRDTHLDNSFVVWVGTSSGNQTGQLVWNVYRKGTESTSACFTLPRSVQLMSVQIQALNSLGSVESSIVSYNLSDIAVMPSTPVIDQVECSSRNCTIKVEQPAWTPHLQVQYQDKRQRDWTTYPDSAGLMTSFEAKHVSSLEPCSVYNFTARSRFSTGQWSEWSSVISSATKEEAPAQHLDVWLAAGPDFRTMRVYWDESNMSVCRGSIVQYAIRVNSNNLTVVTNVSADVKSRSVPFCSDCEVTVQAVNSQGSSPPATMTTPKPILDVQVTAGNHTVAISWRKAEAAPAYSVVEWYPEGHMLDELRWARLDGNENFVTVTGKKLEPNINPWECYEGAVYVFYNQSSVSRTSFKRIATLEAEVGPSAQDKVEGKKVTVSWTQLRRAQRRGCITKFTIYLQNSRGDLKLYSAKASQRSHPIEGLSPDSYSLWMSASTSKGEGPPGQKIKFYIEGKGMINFKLHCMNDFRELLVNSFPYLRFKEIFQCLMPDVVPDPANSKWAKECTKDKGKMNLHLPSHNSSFTDPEEETILVDVEELCRRMGDSSSPRSDRSAFPPKSCEGQETELSALLYPPLTTYIKSLSHDSDSSGHTQTSLDTNMTVDYISSHGQDNLDNSDQEDEEEFPGMQFFPSLSILMEPVGFGGKLTLDAVKIDCGDFFQNA
uniref:Interleukin 12 receptor, beta 2a n=1 Tax=Xiphophorus couchianus TaxID=32473 RepID=A0A3B5LMY2_9TELE